MIIQYLLNITMFIQKSKKMDYSKFINNFYSNNNKQVK